MRNKSVNYGEVKASDFYDEQDPRGMSTREYDDYIRAKNKTQKEVIIKKESPIDWLQKNLVKYKKKSLEYQECFVIAKKMEEENNLKYYNKGFDNNPF